MVLWRSQNAPRQQQFHVAPVDIQKRAVEKLYNQSCRRITCERSESARERRIALYIHKSDQQQQQWIRLPGTDQSVCLV